MESESESGSGSESELELELVCVMMLSDAMMLKDQVKIVCWNFSQRLSSSVFL